MTPVIPVIHTATTDIPNITTRVSRGLQDLLGGHHPHHLHTLHAITLLLITLVTNKYEEKMSGGVAQAPPLHLRDLGPYRLEDIILPLRQVLLVIRVPRETTAGHGSYDESRRLKIRKQ